VQFLTVRWLTQPHQGFDLQLAHPFPRQTQLAPDLLQGSPLTRKPIASRHDPAQPLGETGHQLA
jgi:hypothetical protein